MVNVCFTHLRSFYCFLWADQLPLVAFVTGPCQHELVFFRGRERNCVLRTLVVGLLSRSEQVSLLHGVLAGRQYTVPSSP